MTEEMNVVAGEEDFLLEQPSSGSGACIVIGRWADGMTLPGEHPRGVLWLVDPDGGCPPPPGTRTVQLVGEAGLETNLDDFFHRTPKALPSLYVTRHLPGEHAAHYAAAIDAVAASMEAHRRARVTRQEDAIAWQSHLFANLADYAAHRLPGEWKGALAGIPAFVCGAGPSLDVTVSGLAREAGNAVVFAADSSVRALAASGVQADFVVSVDVAKTPAKCLPEDGASGRIVLAATSPPAWSQAVPADRRFYLSSNQLTLDWLDSRGITRTKITVHENCGATALELARFLGCAPIYLFGMDLALGSDGGRHHGGVEASIYAQSGFDAAQEFPRVAGNFSETVPTHVLGDWRTLDRRLTRWPAGLVHVVTDRGARLSNTRVIHPGDFALPPAARRTKEESLAAFPPSIPPEVEVRVAIAGALAEFSERLSCQTTSLRDRLDVGNTGAAVDGLHAFFAVPDHGPLLGAYALKLLPHLLPPVENDAAFWRGITGELTALGRHATLAARTLRNGG